MPIPYVIRPGDTLGAIAARFGTSIPAIQRLNPSITNINLIYAGATIQIPDGTPATSPNLGPSDEELGAARTPSPRPATSPTATTTTPRPATSTTTPTGTGAPAPSSGGVNFGTPSSTTSAGTGGGIISVLIEREDGSIITQPIYIPDGPWQMMLRTPTLAGKWGLGQAEPFIPLGALKDFRADIQLYLPEAIARMVTEKLSYLPGGEAEQFDLSRQPPPPGFAWEIDPATGNRQLIDLDPLTGPALSSWHYVVTDPTTGLGEWRSIPTTDDLKSVFEGVPDSVRPWLAAFLDSGGDINVVPEGSAREWVEWVADQAIRSSRRGPNELPFGTGLPNYSPGSTVPPFPGGGLPGQGGTTPGGGPAGDDFSGMFGADIARRVAEIFAGSGFNPNNSSAPGSGGPGSYSQPGFEGTLNTLMNKGSVGTSLSGIQANTPAGHFYRTLIEQGLVKAVPFSPEMRARINAGNTQFGQPLLDEDAVQIKFVGVGGGIDDNLPGVTATPPPLTQEAPGQPPTTRFITPALAQAQAAGRLPAGSAGAKALAAQQAGQRFTGPEPTPAGTQRTTGPEPTPTPTPRAPTPTPTAPTPSIEDARAAAERMRKAGFDIPNFEDGGTTTAPQFLVGERGPEVVSNPTRAQQTITPVGGDEELGAGRGDFLPPSTAGPVRTTPFAQQQATDIAERDRINARVSEALNKSGGFGSGLRQRAGGLIQALFPPPRGAEGFEGVTPTREQLQTANLRDLFEVGLDVGALHFLPPRPGATAAQQARFAEMEAARTKAAPIRDLVEADEATRVMTPETRKQLIQLQDRAAELSSTLKTQTGEVASRHAVERFDDAYSELLDFKKVNNIPFTAGEARDIQRRMRVVEMQTRMQGDREMSAQVQSLGELYFRTADPLNMFQRNQRQAAQFGVEQLEDFLRRYHGFNSEDFTMIQMDALRGITRRVQEDEVLAALTDLADAVLIRAPQKEINGYLRTLRKYGLEDEQALRLVRSTDPSSLSLAELARQIIVEGPDSLGTNIPNFEEGGTTTAPKFLVGEAGPEVVSNPTRARQTITPVRPDEELGAGREAGSTIKPRVVQASPPPTRQGLRPPPTEPRVPVRDAAEENVPHEVKLQNPEVMRGMLERRFPNVSPDILKLVDQVNFERIAGEEERALKGQDPSPFLGYFTGPLNEVAIRPDRLGIEEFRRTEGRGEDTLLHELGHVFDDQLGLVSQSPQFKDAVFDFFRRVAENPRPNEKDVFHRLFGFVEAVPMTDPFFWAHVYTTILMGVEGDTSRVPPEFKEFFTPLKTLPD